jgi:hypothetical protein
MKIKAVKCNSVIYIVILVIIHKQLLDIREPPVDDPSIELRNIITVRNRLPCSIQIQDLATENYSFDHLSSNSENGMESNRET